MHLAELTDPKKNVQAVYGWSSKVEATCSVMGRSVLYVTGRVKNSELFKEDRKSLSMKFRANISYRLMSSLIVFLGVWQCRKKLVDTSRFGKSEYSWRTASVFEKAKCDSFEEDIFSLLFDKDCTANCTPDPRGLHNGSPEVLAECIVVGAERLRQRTKSRNF